MADFLDIVTPPKGRFRLIMATAAVAGVGLLAFPVQYICWRFNLPLRRHIPVLFHRSVARIMGLRVRVVGAVPKERPVLFLANHVTWIDIIALGSVMPLSFVAKAEIATWPFFGLLARLQRSVFVDRSKRAETANVRAEIAGRLKEGDPIVLFAEATTSDGNRILPFRSSLVGAAQEAIMSGGTAGQVLLQPIALAYNGADGLPTGRMGRARIGWYGDMEMVPHLKNILRGGTLDVTISFGSPIIATAESDRKALTKQAEDQVRTLMAVALNGRATELR
jgi:lyso-ornithine lipid O-acyltransferase